MFFDPSDVDHRLEFFSELLSCQNHFYRWTYECENPLPECHLTSFPLKSDTDNAASPAVLPVVLSSDNFCCNC